MSGFVCMAVFQPDPDLLRSQIESLKAQTEIGWECLVGIDGADTDAEALVVSLTSHDPRFTIIAFQERVGFYRNFERILARIPKETPWVALSDQDDYWEPGKLALMIPFLREKSLISGQARVSAHRADPADPAAGVLTSRRSVGLAAMMIDNQVTGSLALFRGNLLSRALPFPGRTDLAFHDHWLAICAVLDEGIQVIPDVVQDYVQHEGNVIGEITDSKLGGRLRRLRGASSGSVAAQLDYLSIHRWGWRVNMARAALNRHKDLTVVQRRELTLFADNRASARLFALLVREWLGRRAPIARSLALFVGSARARSVERAARLA